MQSHLLTWFMCAAVANNLFGTPEKGATCSMCLRVYLPQDYPPCNITQAAGAHCAGHGTRPYLPYVTKPWAWSARINWDAQLNMSYFTAIVIGALHTHTTNNS